MIRRRSSKVTRLSMAAGTLVAAMPELSFHTNNPPETTQDTFMATFSGRDYLSMRRSAGSIPDIWNANVNINGGLSESDHFSEKHINPSNRLDKERTALSTSEPMTRT